MSDLSSERWRTVSPHLDRALELSTDERAGWLASFRAAAPALAADLEALLAEHDTLSREHFLENGVTVLPPASLVTPPVSSSKPPRLPRRRPPLAARLAASPSPAPTGRPPRR